MYNIRLVTATDLEGLKQVLDNTDLFPADMLDDMIAPYLSGNSDDTWFTAELDGILHGIGFCAPEPLTEGTYNLKAIAVKTTLQGKGLGSNMMGFIEDHLRNLEARLLLVDTSGLPDFEPTRNFYSKLNYQQIAQIPDFWAAGDAKVTFIKYL